MPGARGVLTLVSRRLGTIIRLSTAFQRRIEVANTHGKVLGAALIQN